MVIRTVIPPRFADSWSFRGIGRTVYVHTRKDRFGQEEIRLVQPEVVEPGEPRG